MNDKQKISLPYLPQQGSFQLYFSSHLLPLADESSEVFACLADIFISSFSLSCKSQNNMSFLTPYDIQPFHSTLHVLAEVTYVLLSVSSPINWAVILPSTRLRCLLEFMTLYCMRCCACSAVFVKPCYLPCDCKVLLHNTRVPEQIHHNVWYLPTYFICNDSSFLIEKVFRSKRQTPSTFNLLSFSHYQLYCNHYNYTVYTSLLNFNHSSRTTPP